jgi:hypothetical protein
MYRCHAKSVEGFVQQLAVSYIGHGYWFYVTGMIPAGKDAEAVDRKLVARYGIDISKWARARRKRGECANVHYLRHGNFFILIATYGQHAFFEGEPNFRDVRRDPIRFHGYSIGYRKGADGLFHPSVRIHIETYRAMKAHFLNMATHRSVEALSREFRSIPFAPYAPIRRQVLNILRAANRERKGAGLEPVPTAALRLRRKPRKVFAEEIPLSSPTADDMTDVPAQSFK